MERRDNVNPFWRHVRVLPPPRQADKKAKAWTSNTTLPFSPCAPLVSEQCPKFPQPPGGPGSHFRWAAQTKQSRNVSVCNREGELQLELTYLRIWRWLWTRGQLTFKKQKQTQRQPKRKRPATLKTETFLSNPEINVKVLQERQGEAVKDSQHELCLLSENNIRLTDHL